MSMDVKVSANGRICIPTDVRQQLGLRDGDTLSLEVTDEGILLRTRQQRVMAVQEWYAELAKGKPPYAADDLIRDRRDEASREEERYRDQHGG